MFQSQNDINYKLCRLQVPSAFHPCYHIWNAIVTVAKDEDARHCLLPMSYKWHSTGIWETTEGSPQKAWTGAGSPCNKRPCADRVWPWPLPSDGAEGRPPTPAQRDSQLAICCCTYLYECTRLPRQATHHCLVLSLNAERLPLRHRRRHRPASWPSIQQRTADPPTTWSCDTRQKSLSDNSMVQCNASLLGRPVGPMSSKAYCRPYIWYVFCAMSVSWINFTVSVHSHLAHVRNSWLKT